MIAKLRIFSEDNQQYNFLYSVRFQNVHICKVVGLLHKTDGTSNQLLKASAPAESLYGNFQTHQNGYLFIGFLKDEWRIPSDAFFFYNNKKILHGVSNSPIISTYILMFVLQFINFKLPHKREC
jgi:predicted permease